MAARSASAVSATATWLPSSDSPRAIPARHRRDRRRSVQSYRRAASPAGASRGAASPPHRRATAPAPAPPPLQRKSGARRLAAWRTAMADGATPALIGERAGTSGSVLFERGHGEPRRLELVPVVLGGLLRSPPDDRLPFVVYPVVEQVAL